MLQIPTTHHIKKFIKKLVPFEERFQDTFARIINAYLRARELRISSIADTMTYKHKTRKTKLNENANRNNSAEYKLIQRFLDRFDTKVFKESLAMKS